MGVVVRNCRFAVVRLEHGGFVLKRTDLSTDLELASAAWTGDDLEEGMIECQKKLEDSTRSRGPAKEKSG